MATPIVKCAKCGDIYLSAHETCPKCGEVNPSVVSDRWRYCVNCGKEIETDETLDTVVCPHCNARVSRKECMIVRLDMGPSDKKGAWEQEKKAEEVVKKAALEMGISEEQFIEYIGKSQRNGKSHGGGGHSGWLCFLSTGLVLGLFSIFAFAMLPSAVYKSFRYFNISDAFAMDIGFVVAQLVFVVQLYLGSRLNSKSGLWLTFLGYIVAAIILCVIKAV